MSELISKIEKSISNSYEVSRNYEHIYNNLINEQKDSLSVLQLETIKLYQLVEEELRKIPINTIEEVINISPIEQIEILLRFQIVELLLENFKENIILIN